MDGIYMLAVLSPILTKRGLPFKLTDTDFTHSGD